MHKPTWRIIRSPTSEGAWNMALDEAFLLSVGRGDSPPILRFYSWAPPCISLGYSQPFTDVDMKRLKERKWDIVRRPSGGRAILHTDELTYSIITSTEESVMEGGIIDSYQRLSRAILHALNNLGANARADQEYRLPKDIDKKGPVCFEVPSNYEITFQGKKLVGSAQVRRKEGILQHGTIPLEGDITRIIDVLNFQNDAEREQAKDKVLERATNLETVMYRKVSWEAVADLLQAAFASELNVQFVDSEPTPEEIETARYLVESKYSNDHWTERVYSASKG